MADRNVEQSAEILLSLKNGSALSHPTVCYEDISGDDADVSECATVELAADSQEKTDVRCRAPAAAAAASGSQPPPYAFSGDKLSASAPEAAAPTQVPQQLKDNLKRLKNLLKLPNARRWVYYEFFYSDIDRELLLRNNEFRQCLQTSFPGLKTFDLNRAEWRLIKRLLGKPRRCSESYFQFERQTLEEKRQSIREIQKGKILTLDSDADLPTKIPQPLVVGSKVFARIRQPQDGIFVGTVDAVMDNRYRITFDRNRIPPSIVRDTEVMNETPDELVSVSFFLEKNKAAQPLYRLVNTFNSPSPKFPALSPMCGSAEDARGHGMMANGVSLQEEKCGNFPVRLLLLLRKLSQLIDAKKAMVTELQQMNAHAEKSSLYTQALICGGYPRAFQERYAKLLIDLELLNRKLDVHLKGVSDYISLLLPQMAELTVTSRPETLRKLCHSHAVQIVKQYSHMITYDDHKVVDLIISLVALLLQVRALGQQHCNSYEIHSLADSVNSIRSHIDPTNLHIFQDCVEVNFKHFELALNGGVTT